MQKTLERVDLLHIVDKEENDCTDDERKIRALEWHKFKESFVYAIKYIKVTVPPTQDNAGGLKPFELLPHIKKAVTALLSKKLIVWMKSRQIYASTTIAAYILWHAMTKRSSKILVFSKGEIEAAELIAKCKGMYLSLPKFMQLKMTPDTAMEIGFPVMGSSIKAFAATKSAGVSFTGSILICDEWQDHPFAEDNFFAAKPTIDAGGQFIGIFTVPRERLDVLAINTFKGAIDGKNDFTWLFDPWHVVPNRDQAWYDYTKRNIPISELTTLTPEVYMQKNYPSSVDEALSPLQTTAAFNLKVIDEMMADVKSGLTVIDGIDTKICNVYKPFLMGEYYICATDTSHGLGKDFSVTVVMNVKTGDIVADIMNNLLPPEEIAYHSVKMLELYRNPHWEIEMNDLGGVTIMTAVKLGYKNFGYFDKKEKRIGFHMGTNRTLVWGTLIPAIDNRQIHIYNVDGLRQFRDVIRNAAAEGRVEAMKGRHDDYPTAVGIAWYKRDEVSAVNLQYTPLSTLTFGKR